MKKVGILTFHRAKNYGAILQAYALKETLCNMNCSTSIINYVSPLMLYGRKYNFIPKQIKLFLQFLKKIKSLNTLKTYYNFNKFRKLFFNEIKLRNIKFDKQFDLFITGSDQVFNPRITGFDKNYFLDFVQDKNKCFSYAASFGLSYKDLTDVEKNFIKENLKSFRMLSLREREGVDIVNKLLEIKTEVHIDPSLLLNRQDWLKISKIPKEDNFAILFLLEQNEKLVNFAYNLAKSKNIDLIYFNPYNKKINIKTKIVNPSPQEWLGYMLKAKYILTNSFHGLCFSINFNKQFFVDFTSNNKFNSRLENLLNLLDLKDRLIDNIETNYDKTMDWSNVNIIIEKERAKSVLYLKSIIFDGENNEEIKY